MQGDLEIVFEGLKVVEVRLMYDKISNEFRGISYVEFESAEDLEKALESDGVVTCEYICFAVHIVVSQSIKTSYHDWVIVYNKEEIRACLFVMHMTYLVSSIVSM